MTITFNDDTKVLDGGNLEGEVRVSLGNVHPLIASAVRDAVRAAVTVGQAQERLLWYQQTTADRTDIASRQVAELLANAKLEKEGES